MLYSILIEFFKLDATKKKSENSYYPFMAVFGSQQRRHWKNGDKNWVSRITRFYLVLLGRIWQSVGVCLSEHSAMIYV